MYTFGKYVHMIAVSFMTVSTLLDLCNNSETDFPGPSWPASGHDNVHLEPESLQHSSLQIAAETQRLECRRTQRYHAHM